MSQTNAIILRIRKDRAREFERLFETEEYEIWKRFHAGKLFLSASLTRVEYGSEEEDARAEQFQPEGPSVWGGTTIFEI